MRRLKEAAHKTDLASRAVQSGRFAMKAEAETLGVSRSSLHERVKGKTKPFQSYPKAQHAAPLPRIKALVLRWPGVHLLERRCHPACVVIDAHDRKSSPGGPSPTPASAARTCATCCWTPLSAGSPRAGHRASLRLCPSMARLHGQANPHPRTPTRSEIWLHTGEKPAIQRHVRGIRQNLQARLRSHQSAAGRLKRLHIHRRPDRRPQRKPPAFEP